MLPINIGKLYKTKFKDLPRYPPNLSEIAKESFMTLNIARSNPIYFSNNVLEAIRDRLHSDKLYFSCSIGLLGTVEGVNAIDTLIA